MIMTDTHKYLRANVKVKQVDFTDLGQQEYDIRQFLLSLLAKT